MLYTISWMVRREQPASRAPVERDVFASFLVGGLVGGSVAGALVAVVASGIYFAVGAHETLAAGVSGVVALAFAGTASGIWRLPIPQLKGQVPAAWRDIFSPRFASFLYSAGLGMFFFTRLGSAVALPLTTYALSLGHRPLAIILIFSAAGLIRAATALALPLARIWDENAIRQFMSRIGPSIRHADAWVLLLVASIAVGAAFHG